MPTCQTCAMEPAETFSSAEVSQMTGLDDWRVLLRTMHASFKTSSMAKGIEFAARIGPIADDANHHPDITLSYPRVRVMLTTHETNGLTNRDVDLAKKISAIAAELGIAAEEPAAVAQIEIAIDALDIAAVKPFWEAVLGYSPDGEDSSDPLNHSPALWFQQMDAPRPQRNRIHIDISVPHDVAERRVADAVAAGGTVLSTDRVPAFWVLADPEGNEVCVCTWQARG
ncbi:MAG: 4a-hydroxytetrahydrobiopterin dehydratase [Verrucomicrobiales bacterium]|jgi:4a-hydroxytetrahydrobiopterin dehydratase